MRIAIYGTGGVGGYFGARLAAAGNDVTFIARGEQLRAIKADGLHLQSPLGNLNIFPAKATEDPTTVDPVDLVVIAVKAWQVPDAALAIKPIVGPETMILPLQNGVEAHDQLAAAADAQNVLGGLCRIVSFVSAPGRIEHVGFTPSVMFAEWDDQQTGRIANLLEVFASAGIDTRIPANIRAALWQKFLFISAYSGVGAITKAPAGVLRSIPETRGLIVRAMTEIFELAKALDIPVEPDAVDQSMAAIDSLPEDATSSMQRDIMAGRPSELESQNGAVVRYAKKAGIAVPVNAVLYAGLKPLEMRARGAITFS